MEILFKKVQFTVSLACACSVTEYWVRLVRESVDLLEENFVRTDSILHAHSLRARDPGFGTSAIFSRLLVLRDVLK